MVRDKLCWPSTACDTDIVQPIADGAVFIAFKILTKMFEGQGLEGLSDHYLSMAAPYPVSGNFLRVSVSYHSSAHGILETWLCGDCLPEKKQEKVSGTFIFEGAWGADGAAEAAADTAGSPNKYGRRTGTEAGSELSLALLATIREAVASPTHHLDVPLEVSDWVIQAFGLYSPSKGLCINLIEQA
jgi:hypothetical protein